MGQSPIVAQSLKSGLRTPLLEGGSDGRYLPSGHIMYAHGGVVYRCRFRRPTTGTRSGPVPMLEGVNRGGAVGVAASSIADDGTLVYVRGPVPSVEQRAMALADRAGGQKLLPMPPAAYLGRRISRDGTGSPWG